MFRQADRQTHSQTDTQNYRLTDRLTYKNNYNAGVEPVIAVFPCLRRERGGYCGQLKQEGEGK
jgi:hypothetical protein